MPTTNWYVIRDGYISTITALTPATVAKPKFQERPIRHVGLREWAEENSGSATFRKFQFMRPVAGEEAAFMDPAQFELFEELELVVAYPSQLHNLFGNEGDDDLEQIMEQDGDQLRDAVTSAGNYQSGQNMAKVTSVEIERDDDVWFLVLTFEIRYFKSQTLT